MKEAEGIAVDKFVDYAIMCMWDFTITKHFILLPAPGAGIHIFGWFLIFPGLSGRFASKPWDAEVFTGSSCHIVSGVVWAWLFPLRKLGERLGLNAPWRMTDFITNLFTKGETL